MLLQAALVEVLLHGEGRAEQTDALEAGRLDPLRRWDRRCEAAGCSTVDAIASATRCMVLVHSTMKSAPPRSSRSAASFMRFGKLVPVAFVLKPLDLVEIDGTHQALRRMHAAEPAVRLLIDDAVILGRAFPAHAADQADGPHAWAQAFGV